MDWYRLAYNDLGVTVHEAQARVSAVEFATWREFRALDPFVGDKYVLVGALIAYTVYQTSLTKKKGSALSYKDFVIDFQKRVAVANAGSKALEVKQKFMAFASNHNQRLKGLARS